jgi:hypothetical protein
MSPKGWGGAMAVEACDDGSDDIMVDQEFWDTADNEVVETEMVLRLRELIVGRGAVDEGCHEKFGTAEEIVGEKVGEILWCVMG